MRKKAEKPAKRKLTRAERKADLARLKALELCELDAFYVDCEDDEDQPHA